jgi:hypothetical protein
VELPYSDELVARLQPLVRQLYPPEAVDNGFVFAIPIAKSMSWDRARDIVVEKLASPAELFTFTFHEFDGGWVMLVDLRRVCHLASVFASVFHSR